MIPKRTGNKTKIDKGIHQTKTLFHNKEKNQQIKKQPMVLEKTFASHIPDKGLISKINKEYL